MQSIPQRILLHKPIEDTIAVKQSRHLWWDQQYGTDTLKDRASLDDGHFVAFECERDAGAETSDACADDHDVVGWGVDGAHGEMSIEIMKEVNSLNE